MVFRRSAAALAVVALLMAGSVGIAAADDVVNDVTSTSDGRIVTVTKGGDAQTAGWKLVVDNTDSTDRSGCNAGDNPGTVATVAPSIAGTPAGVPVPMSKTLDDCNKFAYFSFSATTAATAGDYAVSVTVSGGKSGSTWDYANSSFTLRVVEPVVTNPCAGRTAPTTAPTISRTTNPDATTGWYNAESPAAKFTISPTTNVEYSLDTGSTWTPYGGETTLADEGSHAVIAREFLPDTTQCGVVPGTSSAATTFNIDRTAPGVTPANVTDPAWRNTPLSEMFTFSDNEGGSGLAPNQGLDSLGRITVTASAQSSSASAPTVASATISDVAGNSTTSSVSALIDTGAPTSSASATVPGTPNPVTYSSGLWTNKDVTVTITGNDTLSGVDEIRYTTDGTAPTGAAYDLYSGPFTISTEGATVVKYVAVDNASNVQTTVGTFDVKIDKTPPDVALVGGPRHGASYYFNDVPATPTCEAQDQAGLSGLAPGTSCAVSGYGTTVGSHTVTGGQSDAAGNAGSASATYRVLAWTLQGFYSPVDKGIVNNVKAGQTVPLKFEAFAGSTELTALSTVASFKVAQAPCGTALGAGDDIETYSTGGTSLRYDTTGGQFIQNWQVPKVASNICFKVTLTLQDGTSTQADFRTK